MPRRKKYTKEIYVYLDEETYRLVKELSEQLGMSISSTARLAIKVFHESIQRKKIHMSEEW